MQWRRLTGALSRLKYQFSVEHFAFKLGSIVQIKMFLNVYKYGCSLCDDSFSFMFTYLYLSLTLCAPTMRHLRLALNRRGWSMHSTVRGGPSFWPCAGLTHTHTCYRRSLLPSHSLRWPKANFEMIINDSKWIPWLYAFGLSAVPTLFL